MSVCGAQISPQKQSCLQVHFYYLFNHLECWSPAGGVCRTMMISCRPPVGLSWFTSSPPALPASCTEHATVSTNCLSVMISQSSQACSMSNMSWQCHISIILMGKLSCFCDCRSAQLIKWLFSPVFPELLPPFLLNPCQLKLPLSLTGFGLQPGITRSKPWWHFLDPVYHSAFRMTPYVLHSFPVATLACMFITMLSRFSLCMDILKMAYNHDLDVVLDIEV